MLTINVERKTRTSKFLLKFPYNIDFINRIKEYPKDTRGWNGSCWEIESIQLMDLIKSHKGSTDIFFDFGGLDKKTEFINIFNNSLQKQLQKEQELELKRKKQETSKELKKSLKENHHLIDYKKHLKEDIIPYPHQVIGAKFASELGSCIVSADMGTGKTILSLLASEMKGDEWDKIFIIVPNSLKLNWRNEVEKFTHSKWYIIDNTFKKNKYTIQESKYIITNYEYFRSSSFNVNKYLINKGINPKDIKAIIFDEAHKLKNTKSNTYKNIKKTFKKSVKDFLLLSGTIMPNRLEELYVALNFILPEEFSSKNRFYTEYCGLKYDLDFGWQVVEKPDLERVFNKLDGVMYRVKKEDVLKDLPELSINLVNVEMNSREEKEYKDIEDGFLNVDWNGYINMEDNGLDDNPLVILGRLRKYTSKIKTEVVGEFVQTLNEQGEKVVIFDIFKDSLIYLADKFKHNSAYYGGSVSSEKRQELVDEFQNPNGKVMNLFVTAQTGNAGITLTAASHMILISQSYVPGENEQMYARIHRIGAKNNCNIYIFAIENTVDDKVYYLVKNKLKVISKVIDNVDFTDNVKTSILNELVSSYKNSYKK